MVKNIMSYILLIPISSERDEHSRAILVGPVSTVCGTKISPDSNGEFKTILNVNSSTIEKVTSAVIEIHATI